MSTKNIEFNEEMVKIIFPLSLNIIYSQCDIKQDSANDPKF